MQASVADGTMDKEAQETVTPVIVGEEAPTAINCVTDLVESWADVAVIVTFSATGTEAGAV